MLVQTFPAHPEWTICVLTHDLVLRYDEYEPQEPIYDESEPPLSPRDIGSPSTAAQTPAPAHADPDAKHPMPGLNDATTLAPTSYDNIDGRHVVEVDGDHRKAAVGGLKEKKVADEERTTTPYMTKYERARVLGTRALQIR